MHPWDPGPPRPGQEVVELAAVQDGRRLPGRAVRVAYRDLSRQGAAGEDAGRPVVLLLHGSPGSGRTFGRPGDPGLAEALARRFRVLVPDFPGFGQSDHDVPDLSFVALGDYLHQLLETLGVPRVHVVAYSMAGGPALHLWAEAPGRVASLVLLSSIGVQELEWLGDHRANHALHVLQQGVFWVLDVALPHFGAGAFPRARAYARNFAHGDQRPLRGLLERFEPPLLVVHGEEDVLVPVEAAREHHRLVPQSELLHTGEGHFTVFTDPETLAGPIAAFVERAAAGEAPTRQQADPGRVAAAERPFDRAHVPPARGAFLLILCTLIALSTLVSEDLACIGAGLLAAKGRITFAAAAGASFAGIFVGDMLLFFAGRLLGRAAIARAPLRWLVKPAALERAGDWFARRGPVVILMTRFLPGTRLATYVAAGLLRTDALWFALWFALAGLLWTPALVGLAMLLGQRALAAFSWLEEHALAGLAVLAVAILLVVKLVLPLASHRGRRLLYGRWLRLRHWEFWPPWAFYPPVVAYVAWLALRHRGLLLVTAVNPGIPTGGFVGESKAEILQRLAGAGDAVPATCLLPRGREVDERLQRLEAFMREAGLSFPIVLKPDAGQRGSGVVVARSPEEAQRYLAHAPVDVLAQRYLPGVEFGVFWTRHPDEPRGTIFAITEKRQPVVVGDGRRTLEELILDDPRAPAMVRVYFENHADHLAHVVPEGERVVLSQLGTHCRGAIFLDGGWLATPELEAAIETLARSFDGFFFGRFDLRAPSIEAFRAGRDLAIIELNGLTSEATNIYDPRYSALDAWRILFRQWRRAFEIAAANRARGVRPSSLGEVLAQSVHFMREARKSKV